MNPLLPLTRHGVRWGIWRRGIIRIGTADMHGAATEQRISGVIQRGHTADRLFSVLIIVQRDRLTYAELTCTLSATPVIAERNALLTDISLSLLVPEWKERAEWFARGVNALRDYAQMIGPDEYLRVTAEMVARDDAPQHGLALVAWPAPHIRARLTHAPLPLGQLHCTLTWRD